jgi:hypothetical protein
MAATTKLEVLPVNAIRNVRSGKVFRSISFVSMRPMQHRRLGINVVRSDGIKKIYCLSFTHSSQYHYQTHWLKKLFRERLEQTRVWKNRFLLIKCIGIKTIPRQGKIL